MLDRIVKTRAYGRLLDWMRRHRAYTLLRVDFIRIAIVKLRKDYYIKRKGALRVWQDPAADVSNDAIQYNLTGLHDISGCRGMRIIRPLSVIETYRPLADAHFKSAHDLDYVCDAKVLCIGPRTEGEIFSLIAYGFAPENIRGLDLISYSPFIDLGDMHAMQYEDNRFDITIASCVLVYSDNPQNACREILRVTKDGGLVCISQDTVPDAGIAAVRSLGRQIITSDDYLGLFGDAVDRVFYRHELPERLHKIDVKACEGSNYTMSLIFRVRKGSPSSPPT